MSILSGEAPPEENEGAKAGGKFGNLRQNKNARKRRDKLKFFDSADWAMRQQNQAADAAPEEQPNQEDGVLHVSQMPSIVDGEQPAANNTNSTLISEGSDPSLGSPLAK